MFKKKKEEEVLAPPVPVQSGLDPIEEGVDEDGASVRVYSRNATKWVVSLIAISMTLFHIYGLIISIVDPTIFYMWHWGFGLTLIFLMYPAHKKASRKTIPWYDILGALAVAVITFYVVTNSTKYLYRCMINAPSAFDLLFGTLAILLTLEAARRTIGKGLPVVSIVLIIYAFVGNYLPSLIANKGYGFSRVVSYLFSMEGLFGTAMKMSATNVFLMVLFGSFLTVSGTGDIFMRLAIALAGGKRGGPAKVSVVSSGLFGSISGSAVANVVSTGTLTIPLMKRVGYKSEFAAAVEAVASTGGQIMPPVMGTGAFLMAEMLNIPYSTICLAAIIPALLYYFSVFISIDLEAAKNDLKGMDQSEIENPISVIKEGWLLIIPILILIYFIAIRQLSISRSAIYSIISCIGCSWFTKDHKMGIKEILKTCEIGAYRTLTIISAVGCAGLAIGIVMLTGMGVKFTLLVSLLAGSNLFLALLFTALSAIVLGMGLPTVAAYIICATIMVSGLTGLGIQPIAAHMFIFYYAILSMLTPPVALAAYTAAGISGSNPTTVGWLSVRLGTVAFVLPFIFIYGPALLFVGTAAEIAIACITAVVGIYCFTVALYGWHAGSALNLPLRGILLATGLCMAIPGTWTDITGIILLIVYILVYKPARIWIINKIKIGRPL